MIELGFVVWPCPESVLTPMEPLLHLRERVVLALSAEHPFAQRGTITYAELLSAANPFLRLRWWKTMHPTIMQIAAQSESITVSMESARHMVRSGVGLGFFPWVYIQDDLQSGALVALDVQDLEPIFRETALVRLPRTTTLSAAAEAFVASLHRQARRLRIEILPN